jgi:6,7-dimethyl-8-ribityllumazine synthase
MLKKIRTSSPRPTGGHFAIVASKYNGRYVDGMLRAADKCLRAGKAKTIRIVRVPGAYEIPVVVARLARSDAPPLDAIVCLGVILRGATTHAQQIAEAVTGALTQLQLEHGIPVIHEVLLFENKEQAEVRCLSKNHNRGAEAAQTALEMARVMRELPR